MCVALYYKRGFMATIILTHSGCKLSVLVFKYGFETSFKRISLIHKYCSRIGVNKQYDTLST